MIKLRCYVPLEGKRDALLNHFTETGVKFLFDIERFVTMETVPADATEQDAIEVGRSLGDDYANQQDEVYLVHHDLDMADPVEHEGEQLGWEITSYLAEDDTYFVEDDIYADED